MTHDVYPADVIRYGFGRAVALARLRGGLAGLVTRKLALGQSPAEVRALLLRYWSEEIAANRFAQDPVDAEVMDGAARAVIDEILPLRGTP